MKKSFQEQAWFCPSDDLPHTECIHDSQCQSDDPDAKTS